MSASDDEKKCDSGREGDVANETGNTNGVWRRQSIIGMWKRRGRKSCNNPLARSEDDSASLVDPSIGSDWGGVGKGRSSSFM